MITQTWCLHVISQWHSTDQLLISTRKALPQCDHSWDSVACQLCEIKSNMTFWEGFYTKGSFWRSHSHLQRQSRLHLSDTIFHARRTSASVRPYQWYDITMFWSAQWLLVKQGSQPQHASSDLSAAYHQSKGNMLALAPKECIVHTFDTGETIPAVVVQYDMVWWPLRLGLLNCWYGLVAPYVGPS